MPGIEQQRACGTDGRVHADRHGPQGVAVRRIKSDQRPGVRGQPRDQRVIRHRRRKLPRGRRRARFADRRRPPTQPPCLARRAIEPRHHPEAGGDEDIVSHRRGRTERTRCRKPHATGGADRNGPLQAARARLEGEHPRGALQAAVALAGLHDDQVPHPHRLAMREEILELGPTERLERHVPLVLAVGDAHRRHA